MCVENVVGVFRFIFCFGVVDVGGQFVVNYDVIVCEVDFFLELCLLLFSGLDSRCDEFGIDVVFVEVVFI